MVLIKPYLFQLGHSVAEIVHFDSPLLLLSQLGSFFQGLDEKGWEAESRKLPFVINWSSKWEYLQWEYLWVSGSSVLHKYRAAKLVTGALHFSSQVKLEQDLSWETISDRADFLSLCIFHKISLHETRPLIRSCMPKLHNTLWIQGPAKV